MLGKRGEGTGRQGPYVYIILVEWLMKKAEVFRTTGWEATCEDVVLKPCLKEVETT